jgi:20S proteasome subunit beta 3
LQAQTISCDFQKIFKMGDRLYVGLPGLATDVLTVSAQMKARTALYKLREEREMRPETFMNMTSSLLYERRFGPYFIEPLIAGLEDDGTPFIASTDLIGCPMIPTDFVVGGTCSEQLYGAPPPPISLSPPPPPPPYRYPPSRFWADANDASIGSE